MSPNQVDTGYMIIRKVSPWLIELLPPESTPELETVEIAQKNLEAYLEFIGDDDNYLLARAPNHHVLPEARKVYKEAINKVNVKAVAIIAQGQFKIMVANIFVSLFSDAPFPIKMFRKRRDAFEWLEQQNTQHL